MRALGEDGAASYTASHRGRGRKRAAHDKALTTALTDMMGIDLTAIPTIGPGTALTIASEIGPDFSAFPSAQHFCSWLGVAPGTRISGGKPLPGRAHKAINPVGQALRMAAMSARRSQTFIGARHRARLARKDAPVAITATARELACLNLPDGDAGRGLCRKGDAGLRETPHRSHSLEPASKGPGPRLQTRTAYRRPESAQG